MATAWNRKDESNAFAEWARRYEAATPEERLALLNEGLQLARERRVQMADWIRNDPRRALANAVPMSVRQQMPPEVMALLEDRVAGQSTLSLLAATPPPGKIATTTNFRSALIDGKEYRAYTYGRRDELSTLPNASLNGVALDGHMAVNDSPIRLIEEGEQVNAAEVVPVTLPGHLLANTEPILIEAKGQIRQLCCVSDMGAYEQQLIAEEQVAYAPAVAGNNLPGTSGVAGKPSHSWTHGTKSILIIRVDFSDMEGPPVDKNFDADITEAYAVNRITSPNGVKDFFEQISYGKSSFNIAPVVGDDSPDVTQVFRMPQTAEAYAVGGLNQTLHSDAQAAAINAGYNVASYDRIAVLFSTFSDIPGTLIDYGGLGDIIGAKMWINGFYEFSVIAHELGHNHGVNHANLWKVTDGNPVSPTGTSQGYGDPFDVMAVATGVNHHFSMWHKSILNWLPDAAVTTAATGGVFRIYRFDHPAANLTNRLALKVVRNGVQDYWIGYRRAPNHPNLNDGAYIQWGYNQNSPSNLLDLNTPGTTPSDAPLAVGTSFNDTAAGITLTTLGKGGTGGSDEWLEVQVAFQPRIQWVQADYMADEQVGSVTLTLSRNNNSSGAVSVNYSTSSDTAISGTDFTAASGTVSWANGDMADKTITITLLPDAVVEGAETFTVNLSGVSGGVVVSPAAATVTIVDPGGRDASFNGMPYVNNRVRKILPMPDGSMLLGGEFSIVYPPPTYTPYNRGGVIRVENNGAWDMSYASGGGTVGGVGVRTLERQADGKVLVGGGFTSMNGVAQNNLVRLNDDGSLDTSFVPGSGPNGVVNAMLLQPDGKVVIGGDFTSYNGTTREYLARINSDGSLDTTFVGPNFAGTAGWEVLSLAMQPDGHIVAGGVFYFTGSSVLKAGICRLTTAGGLDSSFSGVAEGAHLLGSTSQLRRIYQVQILADGKILVAGDFTAYNGQARGGLARLTSTGALDTGFTFSSNGQVAALEVQPDGKLLLGGSFTTIQSGSANRLARLSSSGALETAFSAAGGYGAEVWDLSLLADGRYYFGGDTADFQNAQIPNNRAVWRFFAGLPGLPGTLQWSVDTFQGIEGSQAILQVTRTGGSLGQMTVGYATLSGTATTADFTPTQGVLTWSSGDATAKQVLVPITADSLAEDVESFQLQLGQPRVLSTLLGDLQQTTIEIMTAWGGWSDSFFNVTEQNNPAISGDNADPDGDGVVNLIEFALGTNPREANAANNRPSVSVQNVSGQNYLALTFRRRIQSPDLVYSPQTNSELTGAWLNNAVLVQGPTSNGDGTETVTYRDITPISGATARRFMQLRVTRTP